YRAAGSRTRRTPPHRPECRRASSADTSSEDTDLDRSAHRVPQPCNLYTGGSIVAKVLMAYLITLCKRRTASPRSCGCASPTSPESVGHLCGAYATGVEPTLAASGRLL